MSTTIILHTSDTNTLTFSRKATIELHDIPGVLLPFLKEDVHQLPNDLLLQHGVNAREHFFIVDTSVEVEEGLKYHVMPIRGSTLKVCTFQEIFNKAVNAYDDILGQKLYVSVNFSATNDPETHGGRSSAGYPCGTFFLLHSDLTQEHGAEVNVAAVQHHENEDRNNSILPRHPVEHYSPDNYKNPSRENKADAESTQLPLLVNGIKNHLEAFGQVLPEKDGRSIMLPAENCSEDSHRDEGTIVTPKKESSDQEIKSQMQEECSENSDEDLYHKTNKQPEVDEEVKPLLQSGADASRNPLQSIKGEDVELSSSHGDYVEHGKGPITQAEDDLGGSVNPAIESLHKLEIRDKMMQHTDNLRMKQEEEGHAAGWQPEHHDMSPQEKRQVQYLEHVCNGFCGDQDLCEGEHSKPSFLEGLAQMSDLVHQLAGVLHREAALTLKPYVLLHYPRCPGSACKVPHLIAGCPPPSDDRTVSTTTMSPTQSDDVTDTSADASLPPSTSVQVKGIGVQVSFDSQPAFCSLTPENQNDKKESAVSFDPQPAFCSDTPEDQKDLNTLNTVKKTESSLNYASHHEAHLQHHPPEEVTVRTQQLQNVTSQQTVPFVAHQEKRVASGVNARTDLVFASGTHLLAPKAAGAKDECKDHEGSAYEKALQLQAKGFPSGASGGDFRYTIEQEGRSVAGNFNRYNRDDRRQEVPSVLTNGFLHISAYQNLRKGTIIFSREVCLTVGLSYPLPNIDHSLGKGGNGKVTLYATNQKIFAVKKTNYRSRELNSWIKLSNRSLVPLLAVMIDPVEKCCYQFMPRMKENLSEAMRGLGTLKDISRSVNHYEWMLISWNILYILKCVLKGLQHLQEHNMQHCDVKASNILLGECTSCTNIFHCKCPESSKFDVMLADFDSMKETKMSVDPATLPQVDCIPNQGKILGTCGFRAPEQFSIPKYDHTNYVKKIMDGHASDREVSCGGPWCDIWSFGVMLARICYGKPTMDTISDANILRRCPSAPNTITTANEDIHAFVHLCCLNKAALLDLNLRDFAVIANQCLEPKFRERPRAGELLKDLEYFLKSSEQLLLQMPH